MRRKECRGLDSSPFSHSVPHILKTESKARLSLGVLLMGTQTKISPHSLMFQHSTLNVMVHTLHYSLQVFRGPHYCAPHQLPSPPHTHQQPFLCPSPAPLHPSFVAIALHSWARVQGSKVSTSGKKIRANSRFLKTENAVSTLKTCRQDE